VQSWIAQGFYTALDGGLDVMLCWDPVTNVTCIGVTRGNSRL